MTLLIIFAVLKFIDVYSTWLCLKQTGNSESNALMRAAMDKFGIVHTLLADFALVVLVVGIASASFNTLIWILVIGFQALIAVNNVQAYRGKPTPIGAIYDKIFSLFKK